MIAYAEKKPFDWNRFVGGLLLTCLALVGVLLWSIIIEATSRAALETAYEETIGTPVERNEWGQLRQNPEFMCEATIRQWMEICK